MHCSVAFRLQCQVEGTLVFCISAKLHVAVFNIRRLLMALKTIFKITSFTTIDLKAEVYDDNVAATNLP